MNRATVRRWINEYLDGEIGLADKVELERLMDQEPDVRREYKELRQIGLLLGSIPEVNVHPYKFRARMRAALEGPNRTYLTPQRSFAASMLVFMLVITLSFSLYMYQQRMLAGGEVSVGAQLNQENYTRQASCSFELNTGVNAEAFFNRLLLESSRGRDRQNLLGVFVAQSQVFEGAACRGNDNQEPAKFALPLGGTIMVNVAPSQAQALARLAEDLGGQQVKCRVYSNGCLLNELKGYLQSNPDTTVIPLQISFAPSNR